MRRLGIAALVLCVFVATNLDATDKKIRRQVLKNCDAAERRMANLSQGERKDFADYLARALALDLPDQFHDIQIWQGFDPLAEYEVKACAARLSMSLVPESLVALPKLLVLLDDPLVPEELEELAHEAGLQIAFGSRFHPFTDVEASAVAEMYQPLGERAVEVRAEIIDLLGDSAREILTRQLAICQGEACGSLLDEFTRLSPSLSMSSERWRDLFHAKDSAVRAAIIRAAVSLPVEDRVLEFALETIDDPSLEVQKEIGPLLKKISSMKQKGRLAKQATGLGQHFASHFAQ